MENSTYDNEHEDDDFEDDEFEYFEDAEDDEAETIRCPACGTDVYEDAVQCPACREYISPSSSVWTDRPWWWIALGVAGVWRMIIALTMAGAVAL